VPMAHEIPDEPGVSSTRLGTISVRYTSGLNDGGVEVLPGHVVNEANESVVEYFLHMYVIYIGYLYMRTII
jgi:hypothetical protein